MNKEGLILISDKSFSSPFTIDQVKSSNPTPQYEYGVYDVIDGYLWEKYLTNGTEKLKKIGAVSSTSSTAYPVNGIHTDGYWYERFNSRSTYVPNFDSLTDTFYNQTEITTKYQSKNYSVTYETIEPQVIDAYDHIVQNSNIYWGIKYIYLSQSEVQMQCYLMEAQEHRLVRTILLKVINWASQWQRKSPVLDSIAGRATVLPNIMYENTFTGEWQYAGTYTQYFPNTSTKDWSEWPDTVELEIGYNGETGDPYSIKSLPENGYISGRNIISQFFTNSTWGFCIHQVGVFPPRTSSVNMISTNIIQKQTGNSTMHGAWSRDVIKLPGSGNACAVLIQNGRTTSIKNGYRLYYYCNTIYGSENEGYPDMTLMYGGIADLSDVQYRQFVAFSPNILYAITGNDNSIRRIKLSDDESSSNTGTLSRTYSNIDSFSNIYKAPFYNSSDTPNSFVNQTFQLLAKRSDGYPGIIQATVTSDSDGLNSNLPTTIPEVSEDYYSFTQLRGQFPNMDTSEDTCKNFVCFSDLDYVGYGTTGFCKRLVSHSQISSEPSPGYTHGNYPSKILYPISK